MRTEVHMGCEHAPCAADGEVSDIGYAVVSVIYRG